jgi:large subunit ribosomal protein L15
MHSHEKTINLNKLDQIAQTNPINLTDLGYTKLLGTGKITKALTIHVPAYSKSAAEKVKEAGGQILSSQTDGE